MSRENPLWGAPRILSELLLLGYKVAEGTVAKYMVRTRKPPSQTWRTFLANHVPDIAACDFFTVPTVTFRVLYVFIVLRHDRRRVVHFNVTTHPYAEWAAQQIIDAFPYEEAPRFLLRDRDGIYGDYFKKRVKDMGIDEVLIAPRAPWQNPYCERVIGSIRRECLDHVIVLNEAHLHRILTEYFQYYHNSRPHLSLDRNSPTPRCSRTAVRGRSRCHPASRRLTPPVHTACRVTVEPQWIVSCPVRRKVPALMRQTAILRLASPVAVVVWSRPYSPSTR